MTRPLLVWGVPYYPTYYFPTEEVRTDLLEVDGDVAHSPSRGEGRSFSVRAGGKEAAGAAVRYEGRAEYWSVRLGDSLHEDLAWGYRTPLPESQKIAGLISFYKEKVDLDVDGVRQERPSTKFA